MKKLIPYLALLIALSISVLGIGNFRTVNSISELIATNNNPENILTNYIVVGLNGTMFSWISNSTTNTNTTTVFESLYMKNIVGTNKGRFILFGGFDASSNPIVVADPIGIPPFYARWAQTNKLKEGNLSYVDVNEDAGMSLTLTQKLKVIGTLGATNTMPNLQIRDWLETKGAFITSSITNHILNVGINNIETTNQALIVLSSTSLTNGVRVRLNTGAGVGQHLWLMNFALTTNALFTIYNGDVLYDNTNKIMYMNNGDWNPTSSGDTLELIGVPNGWLEVNRHFTSSTNAGTVTGSGTTDTLTMFGSPGTTITDSPATKVNANSIRVGNLRLDDPTEPTLSFSQGINNGSFGYIEQNFVLVPASGTSLTLGSKLFSFQGSQFENLDVTTYGLFFQNQWDASSIDPLEWTPPIHLTGSSWATSNEVLVPFGWHFQGQAFNGTTTNDVTSTLHLNFTRFNPGMVTTEAFSIKGNSGYKGSGFNFLSDDGTYKNSFALQVGYPSLLSAPGVLFTNNFVHTASTGHIDFITSPIGYRFFGLQTQAATTNDAGLLAFAEHKTLNGLYHQVNFAQTASTNNEISINNYPILEPGESISCNAGSPGLRLFWSGALIPTNIPVKCVVLYTNTGGLDTFYTAPAGKIAFSFNMPTFSQSRVFTVNTSGASQVVTYHYVPNGAASDDSTQQRKATIANLGQQQFVYEWFVNTGDSIIIQTVPGSTNSLAHYFNIYELTL